MAKPHIPSDMKRIMKAQPGPFCSCLMINDQAGVIVKADRKTISGLRGTIPIGYRSELGLYPSGAVVRLVFDFYDQPDNPLTMDTFLNPGGADDLRFLRTLATQPAIVIHLFEDSAIEYQYSKQINHRETSRAELSRLIEMALEHDATIERIDFAAAKAAMMKDQPV